MWGKRLELLKQAVPHAFKVGFLASQFVWEGYGATLKEAARRTGASIIRPPVDPPFDEASEYRRVLASMLQQGAKALIVSDGPFNYKSRNLLSLLIVVGWPRFFRNESLSQSADLWPMGSTCLMPSVTPPIKLV